MPERFDLLKVDFINPEFVKPTSGLAYAPVCTVDIGDVVDIGFARGFVVDKITFCEKEDNFIKLLDGLILISRVVYKLKSIKYEDDLD